MFIVLLTSLINGFSTVNASNHIKSVLLNNVQCMIQTTFTNIHPNEYTQELHYHPFVVKLDRFVGSWILLITCLINYVFQIKQKI